MTSTTTLTVSSEPKAYTILATPRRDPRMPRGTFHYRAENEEAAIALHRKEQPRYRCIWQCTHEDESKVRSNDERVPDLALELMVAAIRDVLAEIRTEQREQRTRLGAIERTLARIEMWDRGSTFERAATYPPIQKKTTPARRQAVTESA